MTGPATRTTAPQPGIGLFVRLKLRLIAGALHGHSGRQAGFVLGVIFAASIAPTGFIGLAMLRGHGALATDLGVMAFTVVTVAWAMLPLLVFGTDETLDPTRLALLPLSRWTLARGLFTAALVGIGPLATVIVLLGAVVGLSGGPLSVLVGLVAVALQAALCVAASRALAAAFSTLFRSRRGRDLAVVFGLLMIVIIQGCNLVLQRAITSGLHGSLAQLRDAAAYARWTPPGMAAGAIAAARDGRYAVALAELAVVAAVVAVLMWYWVSAIGRMLQSYDASTQPVSGRRGRTARATPRFTGKIGAVAGKELRYAWRDPRRKVGWMAMIGVGVVVALSFTNARTFNAHGPLVPMYFVAVAAGLQVANQYGVEGPAAWMNMVTMGAARDMRADLGGRNIAHALVAIPCLFVLDVIIAMITGATPEATLRALVFAAGVYGVALGLCDIVSVRFPYALPHRAQNPFAGPGSGRGCLAGLTSMVTMVLTMAAAVPLIIGVLGLPTPWLAVAAPGYGLAAVAIGVTVAANIGFARLPEMLTEISRAM